jgi:hypothetical protein
LYAISSIIRGPLKAGPQEDALAELIKKGSGTGFALASMLSKGSKFGGIDIKRVYFGYDSPFLHHGKS